MRDTFYGKKPSEVPEANQILTEPAADKIELKPQVIIGEKEVAEAATILQKYKQGKANLESRIKEDELWWELRHWEAIRNKKHPHSVKPTSAWLQNMIVNKHADAMDNFPEPLILPREQSDDKSAKTLQAILPVVMEYNDFEDTYRTNWWEKLKHGTAVYGVFWDSQKENGLGDISIKGIDLMKIFYEPGITDIQESANLFITELVDTDLLDEMYPEHAGKMKGGNVDITEYNYDDDVDTSSKSVVIDWYYKVKRDGRTVLHYAKFCNKEVLYASENDPELAERGFYDHGKYPVVLDTLFPEKGTPIGYGYIAMNKDPQMYIDQLSSNILESAMMNTKKRFFISDSTAINESEFADWSKPFVHVAGEIGDERVKEITCQPISGTYLNILQMKVDEMKETSSNRDVTSGGATSGITAASAIAALQEAGNKASRDMISASYKAFRDICEVVIELMRQFYDEERAFRVVQPNETQYSFMDFSNEGIRDQEIGMASSGELLYRHPVFDVKVRAQKRNPFSTMEANQRAQELYAMGFFDPNRAQESSIALNMMEFEGIDNVRDAVAQGQTLLQMVQQQQQIIAQLTGVMGPDMGGAPAPTGEAPTGDTIQASVAQAGTPMTPYGQRLAARSTPNMDNGGIGDTGAR